MTGVNSGHPFAWQQYPKWIDVILSIILLNPSQTEVSPDFPTLRLERNLEKLVPIEDVHAARDEGKVVAATRDSELSDQHP